MGHLPHRFIFLFVALLVGFLFFPAPCHGKTYLFMVPLGTKLDLPCFDSAVPPFDSLNDTAILNKTTLRWIVPSKLAPPGGNRTASAGWTNQEAGVKVMEADMTLSINTVNEANAGVYMCAMLADFPLNRSASGGGYVTNHGEDQRWFFVKRAVNIYGPQAANLLDNYRWPLILAGIITAAFLLIAILLCLIYKCRYKTKKGSIGENEGTVVYNVSNRTVPVATVTNVYDEPVETTTVTRKKYSIYRAYPHLETSTVM